MTRFRLAALLLVALLCIGIARMSGDQRWTSDMKALGPVAAHAAKMLAEGQRIFRYDTFGDEQFWGGALRLHEAIAQVSPAVALSIGLKVDSEA